MKTNLLRKNLLLYRSTPYFMDYEKYAPVLEYIIRSQDLKKPFGERLKKLRKAAKLSQGQLAREIGVTHADISYMETAKDKRKKINVTYLLYFCFRFQASPEYMLGYVDRPDKNIVLRNNDSVFSVIDIYYQEPAKVLESWETPQNDPSLSIAVRPMFFEPPRYTEIADFIVSTLWKHHFELLLILYKLSQKSASDCEIILNALKITFLSKYTAPNSNDMCSSWFFQPDIPELDSPSLWNTYCACFPKLSEEIEVSSPLAVYLSICRGLIHLGHVSEDLLNELSKVPILSDYGLKCIQFMLDCFVQQFAQQKKLQ